MRKFSVSTILMFFFFSFTLCKAQEIYHNEEFEFSINVPSEWQISFQNEWPEEIKTVLAQRYFSKILFMLNPLGVKAPDAPCIMVFGQKIEGMTTSEAITFIRQSWEKQGLVSAEEMAEELLLKKIKQYEKIETLCDYNSSKNMGIAKILYKHDNEENTYFTVAFIKYIGLRRDITFRAYWKGENPEEFMVILGGFIDSFQFDQDANPKNMLETIPEEIEEIGNLSKEQKFGRVLKWAGIILTVSIVLGFLKMLFFRD
jgi:hypothetical protein